VPFFTNLPDTVNIQASTAAGTSLFTVSVDDSDVDQIGNLSVTMTSDNTNYTFDEVTRESFLMVKLKSFKNQNNTYNDFLTCLYILKQSNYILYACYETLLLKPFKQLTFNLK
jgi:hypothetical protein